MEIKKEYEKLKKKFNLPKFKDLNQEFELYSIEKTDCLLRNIRRRMIEKLGFFTRILDTILYPNSGSLVSIHESKFFSEGEKLRLSDLYKDLMIYERQSLLLDVSPSEKEDALMINRIFKEWDKLKKEIEKVVKTMESSWKSKDKDLKNNIYFG